MDPQPAAGKSPSVWVIDPTYSTIQFSIKFLFFFTIRGGFSGVTGSFLRDEADIRGSSVEAAIPAASVNTGSRRRDAHLRSSDFLDVELHPMIRFRSSSVEKGRDRNTYNIPGILTIRGRGREIVLSVEEFDRSRSPRGEEIAYYVAILEIDRADFGNVYLSGLIGRRVKITVQIQAQRKDN